MNPVITGDHNVDALHPKVTEVDTRPNLPGAMVDGVFFGLSILGGGYLAVMVVMHTWRHFPMNVVAVLLVWATVSYLTLPRLHRLLSGMYVPGYFFGRTKTADGLLGDPVNLAFHGTAKQIHAAMTRAGWVLADDITARSTWGIIRSSLAKQSYPAAPVSSLYLFGRKQCLAYQQEVDGSATQRHHLRIWRCPDGWPLPGGQRVGWLGAGTYDTAVGLSFFTLQVTHRIEADIDIERDYIVASLAAANDGTEVTVLEDFSTSYHHRNGGGDLIHTDGALPIIDLSGTAYDPTQPVPLAVDRAAFGHYDPFGDGGIAGGDVDQTPGRRDFSHPDRPVSLVLGLALTALTTALQVLLSIALIAAAANELDATSTEIGLAAGVLLIVQAVIVILAVQSFRGRSRPRTWLMALCVLSVVLGLDTERPLTTMLTTTGFVLALFFLSSPSARRWSRGESWRRKGGPNQAAIADPRG